MTGGRLLAVVGPTGVGKSDLGVLLAERLGGEVVSADSMQVYRGLDIGTGKITLEERRGVTHHLLDVVDPEEPFSAAEYERLALAAVEAIRGRGRLPIVVGGTGLYYRVLVRQYLFAGPGADPALRAALGAEAEALGPETLHLRLAGVDPVAARRIHPRDLRRIIRALEVYTLTGVPLSSQQQAGEEPRFDLVTVGLTAPRDVLCRQIEARVDRMLADGLVDEVRGLRERGLESWLTAVQALGYKEFFPYLSGEEGLPEAVARLKQDTRRFAKRQLTWFRREKEVRWLDRSECSDPQRLVETIVGWTEGVWQGVPKS
jgi:tRNA dimethylallyltransferase